MKKILITSGVIAMVMLTVVLYLLFTRETSVQEEVVDMATTSTEVVAEESLRGTGSLSALLSLGRPLECSIIYKGSTPEAPVTGTYFTVRGMLRGDFIVPEMATGSVSSLIVRDDTLYTWSIIENETYGMKIDLATLESAKNSDTAPDTHEPVPLDAKVAYDCTPWSAVDESIFEVPSDVLFTNYDDIMNMGMEFSTIYEEAPSGLTTQCSLCEQVKGEAQAACKVQFKCE